MTILNGGTLTKDPKRLNLGKRTEQEEKGDEMVSAMCGP